MPSAGLYVHIPFCEIKCGYCDFFVVAQSNPDITGYVEALLTEAELYAIDPLLASLTFDSLYFGGGTPSLLSDSQVAFLIERLTETFCFSSEPEITVETNPDTVDFRKLLGFKAAGVNRLSFGVQSFNQHELVFLDRTHSERDVRATNDWARKAGFDNVSLDVIFGLPKQTLIDWEHNLESAISLQPDHISVYNLTYEPGTPLTRQLKKGNFRACPEETQRRMFLTTIDYLIANGYQHYELSNYARPSRQSRHNLKYWNADPYLGIGVSSHSYIAGKRFWNVRNLQKYRTDIRKKKRPVVQEETLTPDQRALEEVFLGLRQCRGLSLRTFEENVGLSLFAKFPRALTQFFVSDFSDKKFTEELTSGKRTLQNRLMVMEDGYLRLTKSGLVLYDSILAKFS